MTQLKEKVLFLGGDPSHLPSVKIRCLEIANRLGCEVDLTNRGIDAIPSRYEVFLCVKPAIDPANLKRLRNRGLVIWDVIDDYPPYESVDAVLVSTEFARNSLDPKVPAYVIPHYHCKFDRSLSNTSCRVPTWIGTEHWFPNGVVTNVQTHFLENADRKRVADLYRKSGLMLNIRNRGPQTEAHLRLNSGIKLINCMGFGIPSVSDKEPAYFEVGANCTVFCSQHDIQSNVERIQLNPDLYMHLRSECLANSERYHVDEIVASYRNVLLSLLRGTQVAGF